MPHNPQAFPVELPNRDTMSDFKMHEGMTLLDYFAGQALVGAFANPAMADWRAEEIVAYSYGIARLMLVERKERVKKYRSNAS